MPIFCTRHNSAPESYSMATPRPSALLTPLVLRSKTSARRNTPPPSPSNINLTAPSAENTNSLEFAVIQASIRLSFTLAAPLVRVAPRVPTISVLRSLLKSAIATSFNSLTLGKKLAGALPTLTGKTPS